MAALRPLVLVFQEFATVSTPAAIPTLRSIIVGPAYHCRDYPADSDDILVGTYGDRSADNIATGGGAEGLPVAGSDAIIVSDPPDNAIGALLVEDSVDVWMEDIHLQITDDAGTLGSFSTTAPDENLWTDGDGGKDFAALGVRPGDRFVTTGTLGAAETVAFTIQEVGGWAGSTLASNQLRMTANYTVTGIDIDGNAYGGPDGDPTSRTYRVERILDSAQMSDSFVEVSGNEVTIKGGLTHLFDVTGDGTDEVLLVVAAEIFVVYCSLRQDLAVVNSIDDTDDIEAAVGRLDERNPLAVGLFVALQNTTTSVYYIGIQKDSINGAVDRLQGYTDVLPQLEAKKDIYAIAILSPDLSVVAAYETHADGLSTPEKSNFRHILSASDLIPETKVISDALTTGTVEEVGGDIVDVVVSDHPTSFSDAGVKAGDNFYIVADGVAARVGAHVVEEVFTKGDALRLEAAIAAGTDASVSYYVLRGTGTVDRQISGTVTQEAGTDTFSGVTGALASDVGKVIRLTDGTTDTSPSGNQDFLITGVAGTTVTVQTLANFTATVAGLTATIIDPLLVTADAVPAITPATVTTRKAFRQLLDTNATFSTDGVIPGDLLEIPYPPADSSPGNADFSAPFTALVQTVLSENRLLLEAGTDIPVVDSSTAQSGTVGHRVSRVLNESEQVDELKAIPASIANKRVSMMYPDLVTVSGVQNNKTGVQSRQSSVYLACVVAGMSAALPPHQGFTNLGIAGISELHNSSRDLSEDSLTELSNAGYYLFVQDEESSLPYALHQLTTDVSTLDTGELSMVRTFDFVSRFYKDIADDFIGRYNVIDEVLDVLREAINGGTEQLLTRRFPRIGTPVIAVTVEDINVLEGSRDRVEIFLDAEFPAPLNRVGLHIRA